MGADDAQTVAEDAQSARANQRRGSVDGCSRRLQSMRRRLQSMRRAGSNRKNENGILPRGEVAVWEWVTVDGGSLVP